MGPNSGSDWDERNCSWDELGWVGYGVRLDLI